MNIRDKLLKDNSIMRITLAFYEFVRNNSNWNNRIENVISSNIKNISDYDFEYDKKLYSFFYKYLNDNNIRCCVKEYDKFYDNVNSYKYLIFDYNLINNNIIKIYKCDTIKLNS